MVYEIGDWLVTQMQKRLIEKNPFKNKKQKMENHIVVLVSLIRYNGLFIRCTGFLFPSPTHPSVGRSVHFPEYFSKSPSTISK